MSQQELSRELRTENTQLKSDMVSIKSDSDEKESKIEDLRSHIQRQETFLWIRGLLITVGPCMMRRLVLEKVALAKFNIS